ncbi:2-dehydro-3-deoxy-6-phosphogalactonate aldolase [Dyella mobilis]|uniref:2-dehydro-3-deoxy-6-phosphogalactonate aldolase n=1 Tax=Dyella mobilis TaxID=1849582 RepID=A0ABS2KEP1_9GAMM|nr:2-dehydro-3-deoxy-6-phosphogalactonate aldolase [Dyella mobilis]MBM7129645.1 2-dehydro-3-deoxy-6-phosphogalactonate aldolase [Dyella mobilis]GLQ98090.1 2-dehydro-3-deoxy-6-phosphogalactonate aldolase [Dyella mobilis]
MLKPWLHPLPLVAILRGILPSESVAIGRALADAGFRVLEVPLNSPQPMESIQRLAQSLGDGFLVGAGTVMTAEQVQQVADAGGRLIVMPHADTSVIRAAKQAGLLCVPGVVTPTEAFAALAAGADGLKLFPADQISPEGLKAWRAVLPKDVPVLPVGGITPNTMAPWIAAGAQGFGIGSALYAPGIDLAQISQRARAFAQAWNAVSPPSKERSA